MSLIRNKCYQTEGRMVALFYEHGITSWRRHYPLPGHPNFIFRRGKVVVFVDGCFWHGSPICYSSHMSTVEFLNGKVEGNRRRDRQALGNCASFAAHQA